MDATSEHAGTIPATEPQHERGHNRPFDRVARWFAPEHQIYRPARQRDLCAQHALSVRSRIAGQRAQVTEASSRRQLDDAERLLASHPLSWHAVNEAEQLVSNTLDAASAEVELRRRLAERAELDQGARAYFDAVAKEFDDLNPEAKHPQVRHLLVRIIQDHQWRKTKIYRKRRYILAWQTRKLGAFLASFTVFIACAGIAFLSLLPGDVLPVGVAEALNLDFLRRIGDPVIAAVAGLFGASFSVLRGRETNLTSLNLEVLENLYSFRNLLTRLCVGIGAGIIIYFVLLTGVLDLPLVDSSTLKASFSAGGRQEDPIGAYAALALMCFVAGFSEQLVPSVIEYFTKTVAPNGEPKASERHRPT